MHDFFHPIYKLHTQNTLYISTRLWRFHTSIKQLSLLWIWRWQISHCHDNTCTNFRISRMSVPELPSIGRVSILIDNMHSELTKLQERFKLCPIILSPNINTSIFKFNLRKCLDLSSLFKKTTYQKILFTSDLSPDILSCINPGQVIDQVFFEPSNIDPHTSCLLTQN